LRTRLITAAIAVPVIVAMLFLHLYTTLALVIIIAGISCYELYRAFEGGAWGYLVMLAVVAGLSAIVVIRWDEWGSMLVFLPFVSAFVTDAGAYFVGVFLGKRHIFPKISPKKTLEGCIGGIVFGTAAVIGFGLIFSDNYADLALLGLFGAVATEAGDLLFSWIKRKLEIKDYGDLIPGHGGMLDRFDSMVLCAPVMLALMFIL
jgi:CDP-diglyceride synthetase